MNSDNKSIATPINMTNHAYWNLSGDFRHKTIGQHSLKLNCDKFLEMNQDSIPTGNILECAQNPFFDFKDPNGKIADQNRLTQIPPNAEKAGVDHAFVINRSSDEE